MVCGVVVLGGRIGILGSTVVQMVKVLSVQSGRTKFHP